MSKPLRLSDLSPARQALVRLCREMLFGHISGLVVQNGEPLLDLRPAVVVEVKLDLHKESSPPVALPDFELGREILRLIVWLDEFWNGTIERLDVRNGAPSRAFVACGITVGGKQPLSRFTPHKS